MIHFCGDTSWNSQFTNVTPTEVLNYFSSHSSIQIDTETEGRDPRKKKIISLQIGDTENQFVIDVRNRPILYFKELLESTLCLGHNIKFDYKFLLSSGIVLDKVYDTMLTQIVIFNGFEERYGLDAVVKKFLNIDLSKDTRGEFHKIGSNPFTDKQIEYAGLDVAYLHRIKNHQQKYIDKFDLQYAVDVENKAVLAFGDIEYNGMYLDTNEWVSIANNKEKELFALEIEMDNYLIENNIVKPNSFGMNLFGDVERQIKVNYGSPKQLGDTLSSQGLTVDSTNDRELQKHKNHSFVKLILKHRELNKKISTYGKGFLDYINSKTGRVHSDFWQIKHTFRVGSGSKDMNAPNVQNIPSANEYRNCFKPRKGFKWVSIDYSSQELRLMGDFSGEEAFINALNNNDDLHCFAYFKMTGEEITKEQKDKRNKAKTINFGKAYGMSPYKLADSLDISIEEAKELFKKYEKAFPKLNKWLSEQGDFGKKNGYIVLNPIHRGRRWFPEFFDSQNSKDFKVLGSIERASMNTPIQGSAAVAVKIAMSEIRKWLIEKAFWQDTVFMICTVHDQIDFEIHEDYLHIVPIIEKIMIDSANIFVTKVNMEVDTTITDMWQK